MELEWRDRFGLSGKEPFVVAINGRADEAPSIACEGMPSRKVVLDSEHLSFKVTARDDFGVKRVGMEWRGADSVNFKSPAAGERLLAAGGPEQELLELNGTFSAAALGIEPQPLYVRVFAEDYFPGRATFLFAAVFALCPQRRAARHLAHRATQQMATGFRWRFATRNCNSSRRISNSSTDGR